MMTRRDIVAWLVTLPEDEGIGVTDGGLILATEDGRAWLEIGGLPEGSEGAEL